jgi:uncharacterized protein (TIGR03000 family)
LQTPTPAKKPVMEPPAAMPTDSPPTVPAPTLPAPTAPAPSEPGLPGALPTPGTSPVLPKTTATSAENSGILTIWVPFDAKVTINGLETRSTGSRRDYVSYGLKPGLSYKYVIHAQVARNGQMLEDSQTVTLTAGQVTAVAFGFNTQPAEQVASR